MTYIMAMEVIQRIMKNQQIEYKLNQETRELKYTINGHKISPHTILQLQNKKLIKKRKEDDWQEGICTAKDMRKLEKYLQQLRQEKKSKLKNKLRKIQLIKEE